VWSPLADRDRLSRATFLPVKLVQIGDERRSSARQRRWNTAQSLASEDRPATYRVLQYGGGRGGDFDGNLTETVRHQRYIEKSGEGGYQLSAQTAPS
jgi:hypothetical protein